MSTYMQIEGINGSVTAKGFDSAIEIYTHHIERSSPVNQKVGSITNRTDGQLVIGTLSVTKVLDSATIALMQHFYDKTIIPEVKISHCATNNGNTCHTTHTYSNVIISSYDEQSVDNNTKEQITLSFTQCEKRHTPTNTDGSAGTPSGVTYDLTTAKTM